MEEDTKPTAMEILKAKFNQHKPLIIKAALVISGVALGAALAVAVMKYSDQSNIVDSDIVIDALDEIEEDGE